MLLEGAAHGVPVLGLKHCICSFPYLDVVIQRIGRHSHFMIFFLKEGVILRTVHYTILPFFGNFQYKDNLLVYE